MYVLRELQYHFNFHSKPYYVLYLRFQISKESIPKMKYRITNQLLHLCTEIVLLTTDLIP